MDLETIARFAHQLVQEYHPGLADKERQKTEVEISTKVASMVDNDIYEAISDDQLKHLMQMVESGHDSDEEIAGYIQEIGIDIDAIQSRAMARFKEDYQASVAKVAA